MNISEKGVTFGVTLTPKNRKSLRGRVATPTGLEAAKQPSETFALIRLNDSTTGSIRENKGKIVAVPCWR